jgi:hypothetical protein
VIRKVALIAIGFAIAVGVVGVVAGTVWVSRSVSDPTQELAAEGDVAVFGAFYLAVVASVVALLAYQVGTQRPDLTASIRFKDSPADHPLLPYAAPAVEGAQVVTLDDSVDLEAVVTLVNKKKYSARNVYVRLALTGIAGLAIPEEWSLVESDPVAGPTQIAWEGRDRWVHDNRRTATGELRSGEGASQCDRVQDRAPRHCRRVRQDIYDPN